MQPISRSLITRNLATYQQDVLPIRSLKQPSSRTCWATVYSMVDRWANKRNIPICEYVKIQNTGCTSCQRPTGVCDRPRDHREFIDDWRSLGFKHTSWQKSLYLVPKLRRAIKAGHPVQAYLAYKGNTTAHTCLIIGVWSSPFFEGIHLIVNDPLKGVVSMDALSFQQDAHWQDSWEIW
jgi:hypothetical protein